MTAALQSLSGIYRGGWLCREFLDPFNDDARRVVKDLLNHLCPMVLQREFLLEEGMESPAQSVVDSAIRETGR